MNKRFHGGLWVGVLAVCVGCEVPKSTVERDGGAVDAGDDSGPTPGVNTTAPAASSVTETGPTFVTARGSDATSEPERSESGTVGSSGTTGALTGGGPTSELIGETSTRQTSASASSSDASTLEHTCELVVHETTRNTASSDEHTDVSGSTETPPPPLQMSTHGAWCVNPIPIVAVKGSGSILNNPSDDLGQVNAELLERLTICPGEQTQYCDATAEGELMAVMMRECQLPPQTCPAIGAPAATGCSQTWMDDIFGGWNEAESSHYVAQGCCFEGQLEEVYTEECTPELEGARCPRADVCLDDGRCVAGECQAGGPRNCDDGFFCNGQEYCLDDVGCVPGAVPQFDDDPCTTDRCDALTDTVSHEVAACGSSCASSDVTAGTFNVAPSTVRPDLNAYALGAEGSWTEEIQVACGAIVTPSISVPYGTWSCARTDDGEVYVVNEWEVAVSQPVASGCTYEMQYWEVKAAGANAYEGFVFACCIGAEPFDPASPNVEPLPPGP